jgi:hypothetical protein
MEFAKIPFSFSLLFRCMWRSEILPWGRYAPTLNPHLSWNPISSELEISGLQKASAPHFLERIDHQVLLKAPTYSRREPVLFSCCTYHVLSLDGVKIAPLLDQLNKTVSPYISSIQLERGITIEMLPFKFLITIPGKGLSCYVINSLCILGRILIKIFFYYTNLMLPSCSYFEPNPFLVANYKSNRIGTFMSR